MITLEKYNPKYFNFATAEDNLSKQVIDFFKILKDMNINYHLEDRKIFWNNFLKQGLIQQAQWVVTPKLLHILESNPEYKNYNQGLLLKTKRVEDIHGVLLMRIYHIVVAEWSHAGKCRIWTVDNPNTPKFFQSVYKREELTDFSDYTQQHYFSNLGRWQKNLLTWFEEQGVNCF